MNKPPTLMVALVPVVFLMGSLYASIKYLDIPPHIPLAGAAVVAGIIAWARGMRWPELEAALVKGISIAMPSILILIAVGMLIGTWVASGVVPYLVLLGLELLSPRFFLVGACAISAIVSLATGSSWSTAGTVGVALIGVGEGLGVPLPMAAGAIISGAYFGDKMSPFSETTNLAPAVAGSTLLEHIRHMLWTSGPSILISLGLYLIIGFGLELPDSQAVAVRELVVAIEAGFELSPWLLIPPLGVLLLILFKMPALPALLTGAALGIVVGIWMQGASLSAMLASAQEGFVSSTGNVALDELLSRGGLESMFWTIALILCSMAFGGAMEAGGLLRAIAESLLKAARTSGQLIAAVIATCIGINILAPDQYLSLIVPGRMYKDAFEKEGLAAKNLSRCLEDGGTITSPLVPWNSCGVFMMGALMVNPLAYLPFAFFNLINPCLSVLFGFLGWTIEKTGEEEVGDDH